MKFSSFKGENNRLKTHELQVTERNGTKHSYLASSNNVYVDDAGRAQTREGTTIAIATTTGRGLFCDAGKMLFADGLELKRVTGFGPYTTATVDSVAANHVAYAENNGEIFYSDGVKLACLDAANAVRTVGVPVPTSLSGVSIAGSLDPAWYQVSITYFIGAIEGGAYPEISVESAGGVRLTLPAAPAGVTSVGVYLSGPNGEMPLLHSLVAPATGTLDLTTAPTGRALQTQLKGPMPPGELLAFHDSRLLVADGSVIYYSDPYNYGLTNPGKNYLPFSDEVTVMQPCGAGVYIVADQTYFLTGIGTEEMALSKPLLPYGAVKFTSQEMPNETKVFWLSERGVVIGDGQGQVTNVQEASLLLSLTGSGASLFVEGINRIVATNG